jgi:NAD(P)-dependent dehydrogenase (short-subunit alcohol dehydrogenase family)
MLRNSLDLRGRHFLITGAASGIGAATAALMSALGASVSLVDRDQARLEVACAALEGVGRATAHPFDLADTSGIEPLVRGIVAESGPLHGVVHCAGIQSVVPVRTLRQETWREIFAINTEAGLALAKCMASKKVYAGDHGSVTFISSIMALAGSQGSVAYSMSKAALHGMTRSLALEFAPQRLRVNCIAPGFVRTPMFEKTEQLWDEDQKKAVEDLHPLGFGTPEDVANAVAFLAADTGRWITGSILVVDGGYLAR